MRCVTTAACTYIIGFVQDLTGTISQVQNERKLSNSRVVPVSLRRNRAPIPRPLRENQVFHAPELSHSISRLQEQPRLDSTAAADLRNMRYADPSRKTFQRLQPPHAPTRVSLAPSLRPQRTTIVPSAPAPVCRSNVPASMMLTPPVPTWHRTTIVPSDPAPVCRSNVPASMMLTPPVPIWHTIRSKEMTKSKFRQPKTNCPQHGKQFITKPTDRKQYYPQYSTDSRSMSFPQYSQFLTPKASQQSTFPGKGDSRMLAANRRSTYPQQAFSSMTRT